VTSTPATAVFRKDTPGVFRAIAFDRFPWLEHGFGNRMAGCWVGQEPVATLQQVHSATVLRSDGHSGCLGAGDALITSTPGVWMAVRTADCVPVILADPVHRAAAVIHSGWRGTAARITLRALDRLGADAGTEPGDAWAAIGPAIGPCCYEVGPEVAAEFADWFPEWNSSARQLDLEETIFRQLRSAGVPAGQIVRGAGCTRCRADEFHSFRRDKDAAGRMWTAVRIRP